MHDAVYEKLKARLLERPLTPGQTLQIVPWAEELGVSSTPVREALTRLAAEGLILFAPKKGFFARTPSETEIRGLYAANEALVIASLKRASTTLENESPAPSCNAASAVLPLVLATDELFIRIGRLSGLLELSERIQNLSERLRHVRLVEHEIIGNVEEEVVGLRAHLESGRHAELRAALESYHETRFHRTAQICRELLVRAFSSA